MAHQKLFIGMIGLLIASAGGVFVLLNQGNELIKNTQITKEDLAAGVAVNNSVEGAETENQENKEPVQEINQASQPNRAEPSQTGKQTTSSVAPMPDPVVIVDPEIEQPEIIVVKEDLVPVVGDEPDPVPQPVGKININTANSGELQQLSGIGPVLASRIIDYRNSTSLFYAVGDIKNVSGIGDATFDKVKDNITVGNVLPPVASDPVSVPSPGPSPTPTPSSTPALPLEKININTADYEELQNIIGVGEVIAQRIIDYRIQNGSFQSIEEIKNVKGIGDVTFEKMKDEITI